HRHDAPVSGAIPRAPLTPLSADTTLFRSILTGTAGGTAIGNYTPTVNVNAHQLAITPAALTVDLTTNATKVYGTNDPNVNTTTPDLTAPPTTTIPYPNPNATSIHNTPPRP